MKKYTRLISLALISILLLVGLYGCYGNMTLTRKVYLWNGTISDKYMQQVVFWVLNFVPVYSAANFVDVVFLNTIEFWTGTNPMTMNEGAEQIKYTQSGDKTFQLRISENKIIITETAGPEVGSKVELSYDPASSSWFMAGNGSNHKIASLDGDNLNLIYPSGKQLAVTLSR